MAWTTNDILEDLNNLSSMYQNENDPEIKKHILRTINGIRKYIMPNNTSKDTNSYLDNIFENFFKYRKIYPYLEQFFNLSIKTGLKNGRYIFEDTQDDIKLEDAYELLHELFKSCGKEIFKYYSILEKQRDKYLDFSKTFHNCKGFIIPIPLLGKFYINAPLNKRGIKDSLETLAHEYGHGVTSLINKYRYYNRNTFYEIESYFFELIGIDYFYNETKDQFFKNDLYNMSHAESIHTDIVLARKKAAENAMFSDPDYDKAKIICQEEIEKSGNDFNRFPMFFSDEIRYAYSFLCAIELFELFKQDKELAINTLLNIITKNANNLEEELEIINSQITPVKNTDKYLKRIIPVTKK